LRVHELGHALGYNHVLSHASAMNAAATLDPTDFDRDAARVAFERSPGSMSPDLDPVTFLVNSATSTGPAAWGPVTR
jgi:hypothetical protein